MSLLWICTHYALRYIPWGLQVKINVEKQRRFFRCTTCRHCFYTATGTEKDVINFENLIMRMALYMGQHMRILYQCNAAVGQHSLSLIVLCLFIDLAQTDHITRAYTISSTVLCNTITSLINLIITSLDHKPGTQLN